MTIRIMLADDRRVVRQVISALIDRQDGMEVVAEAEDGQQAVKLAHEVKPDVTIMDIHMPGLNGIDATSQIVSDSPEIKVIGFSMCSDRQFVTAMLKAGATGYVLKDCAFEELTQAVHTVLTNRTYLGSGIDRCEFKGLRIR